VLLKKKKRLVLQTWLLEALSTVLPPTGLAAAVE
jgi:hypothetical protein